MNHWWVAALLGTASGILRWNSEKKPWLTWIAYTPLGVSLLVCSPWQVALAGALTGAMSAAKPVFAPEFRALLPLSVIPTSVALAIASALGAWCLRATSDSALIPILCCVVLAGQWPLRALGAPRWVSNPVACTQEKYVAVVHTARPLGDLGTTALVVLVSGFVSLLVTWLYSSRIDEPTQIVMAGTAAVVVLSLTAGAWSDKQANNRLSQGHSIRVGAVVVDGPPPQGELTGLWPIESEQYKQLAATQQRYEPYIAQAAGQGAEILVLPEVCINLDAENIPRWIEIVSDWARRYQIALVAPYFDRSTPANTLAVVDQSGVVATYDKQHPARGLEPDRRAPMKSGPIYVFTRSGRIALHTVICVDLDYNDYVSSARKHGGIVVAPSNDWFGGFELLHHQTSVWAAVITGLPVVRATGHGISSIRDCNGRILAEQSSEKGPVVLVTDVPIAPIARVT